MAEAFSSPFVRSLDANRTIKDELAAAVSSQSSRRRISVTDLVNPRQAFFRWTRPDIRPSLERAQNMLAGTGFHALFGQAISTEEFVEQFIEFEGIVGKIDIYEDIPLELKTTASLPAGDDAARLSYIDQLGMYCTMTGVPTGRLVVFGRERFGRPPQLRAFTLEFASLDGIKAEMLRRRDLLRRALDANAPADLPRCEFFGRRPGCDYQHICGCESAEPSPVRVVGEGTFRLEPDQALESAIAGQLATTSEPPQGVRINDLVFPRKAAYERLRPEDEDEADEGLETRLKDLERRGFRGQLYKALRFGIPGAFKNQIVTRRSLTDRVGSFREIPTLLRFSKFREMVERDRLPNAMSHYFDRLAFECALAGSDRGRLVLYYEILPGDKFMVYDVGFKDLPAILSEADRRLALLESGAHPHELPPCPAWMYKTCAFKAQCACGDIA